MENLNVNQPFIYLDNTLILHLSFASLLIDAIESNYKIHIHTNTSKLYYTYYIENQFSLFLYSLNLCIYILQKSDNRMREITLSIPNRYKSTIQIIELNFLALHRRSRTKKKNKKRNDSFKKIAPFKFFSSNHKNPQVRVIPKQSAQPVVLFNLTQYLQIPQKKRRKK